MEKVVALRSRYPRSSRSRRTPSEAQLNRTLARLATGTHNVPWLESETDPSDSGSGAVVTCIKLDQFEKDYLETLLEE